MGAMRYALVCFAFCGFVGCATQAEVDRAWAVRQAREDAADARAGAAFVQGGRAHGQPSLEVAPLTRPTVLGPTPAGSGLVAGTAAFGAALLGATFSKSPNNFNLQP